MDECFCRAQTPSRLEQAIAELEAKLAEIDSHLSLYAGNELIFEREVLRLCETREWVEGEIHWLKQLLRFTKKSRPQCALCPLRERNAA